MNLLDVAVGFGAGAGGTAALVTLLTPGARRIRRIEHGVVTIFRVVLGVPARDGIPAQPGVMERLSTQDAELAEIKGELQALKDHAANGGRVTGEAGPRGADSTPGGH